MPVINELIRSEQDGTLSFGNYKLDTKSSYQISNIVEILIRLRLSRR